MASSTEFLTFLLIVLTVMTVLCQADTSAVGCGPTLVKPAVIITKKVKCVGPCGEDNGNCDDRDECNDDNDCDDVKQCFGVCPRVCKRGD